MNLRPLRLLLLSLAPAVVSSVGAQEVLETDLVLRLFGGSYGAALSRDSIFVNEVPPVLAREFPLPPRTRPAGGVSHDRLSALAVLDSDLTPAEVLTFYRRTFDRLGYAPPPGEGYRSVFVDAPPPQNAATRCKDGRVVSVTATRDGGVTDVRLDIYGGREGDSCDLYFGGGGPKADGPPLTLVPPLVNPGGARMLGGGQSGGEQGSFSADQQLETDLTPRELLRHYGEQLRAGDWDAVALREDTTLLRAFTLEHSGTRYTLILSVRSDGDGLATVFVGGG